MPSLSKRQKSAFKRLGSNGRFQRTTDKKIAIEDFEEFSGDNIIWKPLILSESEDRSNCDYSLPALRNTVPRGLDSVRLSSIRKFAQKSLRFMDAYRQGLDGRLADYAVKKYKSHRRIPDDVILEAERLEQELAKEGREA